VSKSKNFISTDPSSHNSENTWFTPKKILSGIEGSFDLDPCTVSYRPFDIARINIEHDKGQDGLSIDWKEAGRIFCNPPYGEALVPFVDKFIAEKPSGFFLIFARMGSEPVQKLIEAGAYFFFLRKRIVFISKEGKKGSNAGTDSMLVFFDERELENIFIGGSFMTKVVSNTSKELL